MNSKILDYVHKEIERIQEIRNFQVDPEYYIKYENGKQPSGKVVRDHHVWLYIGKMVKQPLKWEKIPSLYKTESLQGMFEVIKQTKAPWEVVYIYIWSILYDLLAGSDIKADTYTFDEQKNILYDLANLAWIPKEEIVVISWQENHAPLFDKIKEKWLAWLLIENPISFSKDDLRSSLKVAQLLYSLCQKHPSLDEQLTSLTPPNLENKLTENDPLKYYGMLEAAVRIADANNEITTQGWFITQQKFDKEIGKVTSGKSWFEELDAIFAGKENRKSSQFDKWYFKNDAYKKVIANKEDKKHLKRTTLKSLWTIAGIALLSILGKYQYNQYQNTQEQRQKEIAKNTQILRWMENYLKNGEKTTYYGYDVSIDDSSSLNFIINTYINDLKIAYWWWNASELDLTAVILPAYTSYQNNIKNPKWWWHSPCDFIDDVLLVNKDIRWNLQVRGFSLEPYEFDGELKTRFEEGVLLNTIMQDSSLWNSSDTDEITSAISEQIHRRWYTFQKVDYNGVECIAKSYDASWDFISILDGSIFARDVYMRKFPALRYIIDVGKEALLKESGIYKEFPRDAHYWKDHYKEFDFNNFISPIIIQEAIKHEKVKNSLHKKVSREEADSIFTQNILPHIADKIKHFDRIQIPVK
jgi:hypothetical protein